MTSKVIFWSLFIVLTGIASFVVMILVIDTIGYFRLLNRDKKKGGASEWQDPATGETFPNPLGLKVLPADWTWDTIGGPWMIALVSTVALCALSVLVRYRRSNVVEREQLKWFLSACAIFVVFYASTGFLSIGSIGSISVGPPEWFGMFINVALNLLPVSIGVAILRYRLYDIDVIIRKTLVYSVLTALLALIYFGGVVLVQQLTRSITGTSSDVAIVVSTLGIAALFFSATAARAERDRSRQAYRRARGRRG